MKWPISPRWYVLEKILKLLDAERRKKQLYREICEWKEYLENSKLLKSTG